MNIQQSGDAVIGFYELTDKIYLKEFEKIVEKNDEARILCLSGRTARNLVRILVAGVYLLLEQLFPDFFQKSVRYWLEVLYLE